MRRITILLWLVVLSVGTAQAQRPPHIAYVYPAGGRIGTTFQVIVGGQALGSSSNVFITGQNIEATFLEFNRPMNQKEFSGLREQFRDLEQKLRASRQPAAGTNSWTSDDAQQLEQVRAKLLKNPPNRAANPALIETVALQISLGTNASPGEHELRLAGANGLSNPLKFVVGTLPEVSKPRGRTVNPDLAPFLSRLSGLQTPSGTPKYEAHATVPFLANGQLMPGGVDRYRFSARRGQNLTLAISARQLMPYLADAVPGWFEAVLTILDAKGKELQTEQRFRFRPDPVLHFEVPHDGEYTVELHDSIYRGRDDFVYRLTVSDEPFVTGIFPLGGTVGRTTTLALQGWNLPQKEISVTNRSAPAGITKVFGQFMNRLPFALDELPECLEEKPNNSTARAQALQLPIIVNGRIAVPGEAAFFKFEGRAGQQIVAEVMARRLDSPLDSSLRLTDASGAPVAFNDDFEDKSSGLNTHHADSYLSATLNATGTYFLELSDIQGQGGPDYAYRLRLSEPRPDFALRLTPSSISLRAGMSAPLTIYALRRDGFTNEIKLALTASPEGFSLSGARIAAGAERTQFTLKAPREATETPAAISIIGQAAIGGKQVVLPAVPCEDMMQAFAYRHLVPSIELDALVMGSPRLFARDAFQIRGETPLRICPGGTASLRVSTPFPAFLDRFSIELEDPPEGIMLEQASTVENGVELVFRCKAENAKPGTVANLICRLIPKAAARTQNPKALNPGRQRPSVGTFPAIPIEVMASK
jgi:hypothetical protein